LAPVLHVSYLSASAQKEPAIWFFGDHNGLDFRSGPPVATTNSNIGINCREIRGVATVTNANAELLFYAAEGTIYNRNHDTMQNGSKMNQWELRRLKNLKKLKTRLKLASGAGFKLFSAF
jgi:hypothetical protein